VSMAGTGSRERRPGGRRRRVALVSGSEGLAAMLEHLLGAGAALTRFASLREADEHDGLAHPDTVVLDLSRDDTGTVGELRRRFGGELIVLAERGHRSVGVPAESTWTLVERPFSAVTLAAALGLSPPDASPAPAPAAEWFAPVVQHLDGTREPPPRPSEPPRPVAAAPADSEPASWTPSWTRPATHRAGKVDLVGRVTCLLAAVIRGWQARRRVRVAGFSVFALVAFTAAFALASQGRCGPGCDAFGTGFSPIPTIAPIESSVPQTSRPRHVPASTATTAAPPRTGVLRGVTGGSDSGGSDSGGLATTTTTTGERVAPPTRSATTRTATTRTATTQTTTPPTTAPPTTATTTPTTPTSVPTGP